MEINIGWPEAIYLLINIAGICLSVAGKAKGVDVASVLTWVFVTLPLLYWGGFFS